MGNCQSDEIRPGRGVRQGDQLPSLLLNMITLSLVFPGTLGFHLGSTRVRALVYADDIVLSASSPAGLRVLLEALESGLRDCGLQINPAKSRALTLTVSGKQKLVALDEGQMYYVNGDSIGSVFIDETRGYLGFELGETKPPAAFGSQASIFASFAS